MEQFVTYLRVELRKFGADGDAAEFLAEGGCWEVASVPSSVAGLTQAFGSQPDRLSVVRDR